MTSGVAVILPLAAVMPLFFSFLATLPHAAIVVDEKYLSESAGRYK